MALEICWVMCMMGVGGREMAQEVSSHFLARATGKNKSPYAHRVKELHRANATAGVACARVSG